jgi:predicted RNA-binding Zn ribbon-like protein
MERQALIDASVQPGGRAPAPEALALVQAFVNTVDREHGPDLLDDAEGWAAWCEHRGYAAAPSRRHEARLVREALRDLLWANAGHANPEKRARPFSEGSVLDRAAFDAQLTVRFAPARLEARRGDALGAVLAEAFAAMADGTWARLKACPGERCGWAFYDRSVNASSAWCSMRICGGRAKARAYYGRKTGRP